MAIKKTINIDVNASSAIKTLDELGGSFEEANGEGAIPLSTTIGELEDRLYAMAAAGDTASKEFVEISGQVGKMKKVIIDTDLKLDGMSQNLTQNVGGALQGVAGGFALAQGAMGAFGAGGKEVEEALLKVQSAMAISQGIESIRLSIASFRALRTSIMASTVAQKVLNIVMLKNPIGIIVLAVGALGTAIAFLWKPIKNLISGFSGITKSMGLFGKVTKTVLDFVLKPFMFVINGVIMALKALGIVESDEAKASKARHAARLKQAEEQLAKEKELRAQRKKANESEQSNYDELIALARAEGNNVNELTKKKIQGSLEYQKEQLKEIQNHIKSLEIVRDSFKGMEEVYNKIIDTHKESLQAQENSIKEAETSLKVLDVKVKTEGAARNKTFLDKKLAEERRIEDLKNNLIKDSEKRALAERRTKFERELEDLKTTGALGNETKRLLEEQLQRDLIKIRTDALPKEIEIKTLEVDSSIEANRLILENEIETARKKEELAIATAEKQKQIASDLESSKFEMSKKSFQLVSDVAALFAGRSEKAARAAFNIQKASSIAIATISTYQAAQSAYASQMTIPTTDAPIRAALAAGIAVASGLAQVASIAKTKFKGGGGASAPSVGGGGSGAIGGGSQAAQFNVVGNTGINQLAEGLGGQGSEPIQTYVVSGDVTTAQSLDRSKIDTATI